MTAVEWLFEQLWKTPQYETEWQKLTEQAKEMEKKMVIDIVEKSRATGLTADYLLLTYGSKGSGDTSSQTEISDEEIEKELNLLFAGNISEAVVYKNCFRMGAKWYREQLKSRQ